MGLWNLVVCFALKGNSISEFWSKALKQARGFGRQICDHHTMVSMAMGCSLTSNDLSEDACACTDIEKLDVLHENKARMYQLNACHNGA